MSKILELARKAGMGGDTFGWLASNHAIQKFYELARADLEAENERLSAHMIDLRALHAKRVADLEAECERRKTQFASAEFAVNELKAEIEKLRNALQRCKDEAGVPENVWKAARAALGEK